MIYKFSHFLIKEIADTVVKPNILLTSASLHNTTFRVKIKDNIYFIYLNLFGSKNNAILKIDFMVKDEDELSDKLTNDGALLVMANVIAVIKYWFKLDIMSQYFNGEFTDFLDITLSGIWINAKSEREGDNRRMNIYKYYLNRHLEKIGINVLEVNEISKERKLIKELEITEISGLLYKIEPMTIRKIRKMI